MGRPASGRINARGVRCRHLPRPRPWQVIAINMKISDFYTLTIHACDFTRG